MPSRKSRYERSHSEGYKNRYVVTQTGCWIWTGSHNGLGYGELRYHGKKYYAHRWFWEHKFGTIPAGLVIDHLCNEPACVNPDHLRVTTQGNNIRRSWSKPDV